MERYKPVRRPEPQIILRPLDEAPSYVPQNRTPVAHIVSDGHILRSLGESPNYNLPPRDDGGNLD